MTLFFLEIKVTKRYYLNRSVFNYIFSCSYLSYSIYRICFIVTMLYTCNILSSMTRTKYYLGVFVSVDKLVWDLYFLFDNDSILVMLARGSYVIGLGAILRMSLSAKCIIIIRYLSIRWDSAIPSNLRLSWVERRSE